MVLRGKNWTLAVLAFATVIFLSWYAGVNFLTRDIEPALWFGLACAAAVLSYFYKYETNPSRVLRFPMLRRSLWTLGVFVFMVAEGWYAGVNYAARGNAPACALGIALAYAGMTWWCPVWEPIKLPALDKK